MIITILAIVVSTLLILYIVNKRDGYGIEYDIKRYKLSENTEGIKKVTVRFEDDKMRLSTNNKIKYTIDNMVTSPTILYEYVINNTYFPNVIESIIKDYIGYRLIQGFNDNWLFMVSYPNGIECYNKKELHNITHGFYATHSEQCNKLPMHYRKLLINGGIKL